MTTEQRSIPVTLGGRVLEPSLPLPVVHYPGHYGTYVAFGASDDAVGRLCECSRQPLRHELLLLRDARLRGDKPLDHRPYIDVPGHPVMRRPGSVAEVDNVLGGLSWAEGVCHRCLKVPPSQWWAHPMYAGLFKRTYGWYVAQTWLRLGMSIGGETYLSGVVDPATLVLLEAITASAVPLEEDPTLSFGAAADASPQSVSQLKEWSRARRALEHAVENACRAHFGVKPIGSRYVGETLLTELVASLLPNESLERHARPEWLGGLELDVWLPGIRLAVEYQGQQHYAPIKAWGGEDALLALQERDARKARLCASHGVRLLEVRFDEPLTVEHVAERLASTAPEVPLARTSRGRRSR